MRRWLVDHLLTWAILLEWPHTRQMTVIERHYDKTRQYIKIYRGLRHTTDFVVDTDANVEQVW